MPEDPRVNVVWDVLGHTQQGYSEKHRAHRIVAALDAYDREHPEQVPWLLDSKLRGHIDPSTTDQTFPLYLVVPAGRPDV